MVYVAFSFPFFLQTVNFFGTLKSCLFNENDGKTLHGYDIKKLLNE